MCFAVGDIDHLVCSSVVVTSRFLACCWHCSFLACCWHCSFLACCWHCSFLACCWHCSFLACCWHCSFLACCSSITLFLSSIIHHVVLVLWSPIRATPLGAAAGLSVTPCVTFVVCWTDQHHYSLPPRAAREGLTFELNCSGFASTSFSCSGGQPEHEHDHVLASVASASGARSHRSSSSCGRHRVGHVPHGQWALLGTDTLVLIDRSACPVEPNTCDQRTKCARASRSAHGFRS